MLTKRTELNPQTERSAQGSAWCVWPRWSKSIINNNSNLPLPGRSLSAPTAFPGLKTAAGSGRWML